MGDTCVMLLFAVCVFHFNDVKQSIILLSLEVYLSVQRNNIKLILALLSTTCNEHKHSCSTHALAVPVFSHVMRANIFIFSFKAFKEFNIYK